MQHAVLWILIKQPLGVEYETRQRRQKALREEVCATTKWLTHRYRHSILTEAIDMCYAR
jgi:hypothetical protein